MPSYSIIVMKDKGYKPTSLEIARLKSIEGFCKHFINPVNSVIHLCSAVADLHAIKIVHGNLDSSKVIEGDSGALIYDGFANADFAGKERLPNIDKNFANEELLARM